ncbi:8-oxo-dGTP pyrophosphatase MutT (NUDIX family) [Rhizobium mesoamericanum]|uniref:NUDIX hydrolase n=1 Tax=Rhizobium mesoamericanum TaxID=1079800 RepID=UPI002788C332|nr:NUDIX hydrolase [Rhizobium mesoamericanum]MDQ0562435.1 8-oxo-dGTP pyrophosphatase MutT (NUDIX family) [Rhizobium mesoamericanum]
MVQDPFRPNVMSVVGKRSQVLIVPLMAGLPVRLNGFAAAKPSPLNDVPKGLSSATGIDPPIVHVADRAVPFPKLPSVELCDAQSVRSAQSSSPKMNMKSNKSEEGVADTTVRQFGALCLRWTSDGPEILLITTRETKRWMIPKGWPIRGLRPHQVAKREAWEEAGAIGKVERKRCGRFRYAKLLTDGREVEPIVEVYFLKVRRQKKRFPEMTQRSVAWLKPAEAARRVKEPELKRLLTAVAREYEVTEEA